MKHLKRFLNITILSLLIGIILLNLFAFFQRAVLQIDVPKFFGYTSAVVISGSMEPAIAVNDLVVVKEAVAYELDDVIMFAEGEHYTTHRIIEVAPEGYVTKGDANNTDDGIILKEQVAGKVVQVIPKIGGLQEMLLSTPGVLLMFTLGSLSVWLLLRD